MMRRIFHISNRVDIPEPGKATAGGLDEAICKAPDGYTIVRFGWSGRVVDDCDYTESDAVNIIDQGGVRYITVDLKKSDYNAYYTGLSNSYLWPLFHSQIETAQAGFNKTDKKGYEAVNRLFADIASHYIEQTDTVLVHDYHLMPLAQYLQTDAPMGFFLHIPVPPIDIIEQLDREQQQLVHALFSALHEYDFVGVQSKHDLSNLSAIIGNRPIKSNPDYFETVELRSKRNKHGTVTKYGAFPVAGHIQQYTAQAQAWEQRPEVLDFIQENTPNGYVDIMSVDRLDPSKGLVAKTRGCGRYLRDLGTGANFHLLQIAPFGRSDVLAYQLERERVRTSVHDLNEMFGGPFATLYVNKVSRPIHLGLARNSNIGLVSSLRDGFNLYALEYLAAQQGRENPGIMIASKHMGVSEVYGDCLLTIDPRNPEDYVTAIRQVREMSPAQRNELMSIFRELSNKHTNTRWQSSLIEATQAASVNRAGDRNARALAPR